VKAEPNAEKRSRAAVDFAATSEKNAEASYDKGDLDATLTQLKIMAESIETARAALASSGRTPGRNPGIYKYAEQKSQDILTRLRDLEQRMDDDERQSLSAPKTKIQEIHDEWFEGIMGRKK
jgi:hypothetical protein